MEITHELVYSFVRGKLKRRCLKATVKCLFGKLYQRLELTFRRSRSRIDTLYMSSILTLTRVHTETTKAITSIQPLSFCKSRYIACMQILTVSQIEQRRNQPIGNCPSMLPVLTRVMIAQVRMTHSLTRRVPVRGSDCCVKFLEWRRRCHVMTIVIPISAIAPPASQTTKIEMPFWRVTHSFSIPTATPDYRR